MQANRTKIALVTGASGFLGRYVVKRFGATGGWEAIGLCRRHERPAAGQSAGYVVRPVEAWPDVVKHIRPQALIHCAGGASVAGSLQAPLADFFSGPALTSTLLDAVRQFAPGCAFIFLSSAAVYGQPEHLPIGEAAPLNPISPYGFHKMQSEAACREYAAVYGLRTASARIFSAYGSGLKRQVVWDLCQKAMASESMLLQGVGDESRDFVHASDVAQAIMTLCNHAPLKGEAYNVASGQETTIADLAKMTLRELGRNETAIRFEGRAMPGNPSRWCADISRIKALGYSCKVTLIQGIRDLIIKSNFLPQTAIQSFATQ
jgi:UDP-glucose 4-epimerase